MDHYLILCDSKVARKHHKTDENTPAGQTARKQSKGAFSSLSCKLASSQASKNEASVGSWNVRINRFNSETSVRNVETGALKSILVFVRHVRFKVMNLHTPLPECCLRCVGDFGATRDPNLVNRGEQTRNWRENGPVPNPSCILQYSLEAFGCYIHVFTILNWKYVIPVLQSALEFPPPLHRISKQVRVTAL